jgi:hypothetical protein
VIRTAVACYPFLASISRSPRGRVGGTATALNIFTYLCLRDSTRSPLAGRHAVAFPELLTSEKPVPFPRGGASKVLWECKVTPAYCACQEGNTIGCILSNDGLGAGVVDLFSTSGIHRAFTKEQWPVVSGQWPVEDLSG